MARPRKQGLDYFPHDCDASSDEKIETLMFLYGTKGYAFYFILLERIYRTNDLELDVSDAETIQILSKKIGINVEEFHQILNSALKHRCFDADVYEERQVLTSEGIKRRSETVLKKREQMRNLSGSKKQMENIVTDAETHQETQQETTPETPQSKVKKSKEKKSILKDTPYEEIGHMTLYHGEYKKLVDDFGEFSVRRKIEALRSWPKIAQCKDANATLRNWLNRDLEKNKTVNIPAVRKVADF